MSFSLSLNAHHGSADPHEVENTVRVALAKLVQDLEDDFGIVANVSFSGATGQGLELTSAPDDGQTQVIPDAPAATEPGTPPAG